MAMIIKGDGKTNEIVYLIKVLMSSLSILLGLPKVCLRRLELQRACPEDGIQAIHSGGTLTLCQWTCCSLRALDNSYPIVLKRVLVCLSFKI